MTISKKQRGYIIGFCIFLSFLSWFSMSKTIYDENYCRYGEPCIMPVPDTGSTSTRLELYLSEYFHTGYGKNGTMYFYNQDTQINYSQYWYIEHDNPYMGSADLRIQFSLPPGTYIVTYDTKADEDMKVSVIGIIPEIVGYSIIGISIITCIVHVLMLLSDIYNEAYQNRHKKKTQSKSTNQEELYIPKLAPGSYKIRLDTLQILNGKRICPKCGNHIPLVNRACYRCNTEFQ